MEPFYTAIEAVFVNNTEDTLIITAPNVSPPMELEPGAISSRVDAGITNLNILHLHVEREDLTFNDPMLLFVGDVQAPTSMLQQAFRTGTWASVELDETLALDHFIFTLEIDGDGLVIVGTVELVATEVETA